MAKTPRSRKKSLQALISEMAKDPAFAKQVIEDPRRFRKNYELSDKAVAALKSLYLDDFKALKPAIADPDAFAAAVTTVGESTVWQGSRVAADGGGCYYGG